MRFENRRHGLLILQLAVLLLSSCAAGGKGKGRAEADRPRPLAEFLAGTRWQMGAGKDFAVVFRPDGVFEFPAWKRQGITAVWKVTGPAQVTVTVTSEKYRDLTTKLVFNEQRTSFGGLDLDGKRRIEIVPFIHEDNRRPAAPENSTVTSLFSL
jgi:hypothetical protein